MTLSLWIWFFTLTHMRFFFLLCTYASMLAVCNHAVAVEKVAVTVLMSEELDEKNKVVPLSPDILHLFSYLEKNSGLQFDVQRYPWLRALENAYRGDGVIFGISKTPERQKLLSFSEPLFADQVVLISRCDSVFPYATLADLRGKVIGVARGASYGNEFDQAANTVFKVEYDTNSNAARLRKLYTRRMDAIVFYSRSVAAQRLVAEINAIAYTTLGADQATGKAFCVLPKPITSVDIHFAIRADADHGVMAKLNAAILRGRSSGELTRIFSEKTGLSK
ncbi:substrate-binding periplasmic protein [Undibacterium sp. Rencai35W]|uniref:substrate-binding periplasmic protein n=1 Tax=Undibacterium sp. Rencai35W TaxID=3413046 RepID=UPI003BF2C738